MNSANRFLTTKAAYICFLVCFFINIGPLAAIFIFVKPTGNDASTGNSWANAFKTLTKALTTAAANDQIWLAAGTYKPTTTTDRTLFFSLKNGVSVYGGFAGTETLLSQRNFTVNVTICSGDIGIVNDSTDNSYHVFYHTSINNTAILDGVTITRGTANGALAQQKTGAGMSNDGSASPTIVNCIFSANAAFTNAGAIYNFQSSPIFTDCQFTGNTAGNAGGVIFNNNTAHPTLSRCRFAGNSADIGGAIYNSATCSPDFTDCTFSGNTADSGSGGAIYTAGSPTIINCTFSGNSSLSGGGAMYTQGANAVPVLTNCIIWGNSTGLGFFSNPPSAVVTYSDIQGANPGTGNISIDPLFVAQPPIGLGTTGNLRLQGCSHAINGGLNSANTSLDDLDGNTRISSGTIDKGAFEFQGALNFAPPTGNGQIPQFFVTGDSNTLHSNQCLQFFGTLKSGGIRPVVSWVTSRFWVDATNPSWQGKNFVTRHFDIAPQAYPATYSGRLILYFTQAEFTNFNNLSAGDLNLPVFPTDQAGISHLRVYRFGGTSASGTAAGYTGGMTETDPSPANIAWNSMANRWEITLDQVGFGGFFVGTSATTSLCPGSVYTWHAASSGSTYQWQTWNGSSWVALNNPTMFTGATTATLQSTSSLSTSLYGTQLRCLVNGTTPGPVYTIKFVSTWLGNTSSAWNNPANWSCGSLPNNATDIRIPNNAITFPVISASTSVRSLLAQPDAEVHVNTGVVLQITGQ
ncbi:MAG: right-handed parallel beta-helix repeat-containing protein [Bacteroidota bacterium]